MSLALACFHELLSSIWRFAQVATLAPSAISEATMINAQIAYRRRRLSIPASLRHRGVPRITRFGGWPGSRRLGACGHVPMARLLRRSGPAPRRALLSRPLADRPEPALTAWRRDDERRRVRDRL